MNFFDLKISIKRRFFKFLNYGKFGKLGKRSVILKPLYISGCKFFFFGKGITIRENARIEAVSKWNNEFYTPELIIEDNVLIEQGVHITCAKKVHIHSNVLIAPFVYITDCGHSFENVTIPVIQQPLQIKDTEIGENSWLGIGVKVLSGVHIGKHCIVGANSVVTKDIPDFCVATGCPAKVIKRYNFENNSWEKN